MLENSGPTITIDNLSAGVHPIVRQDGMTSTARSFRPDDWRVLLETASVRPGAWIFGSLPFGLCVEQIPQRSAAPDQIARLPQETT
jgi:hypothetical protein